MPLIDFSYFIGELNIANTDTLPIQENLQIFINKYEQKFLKILLGAALYTAYVAGITPVAIEDTHPVEYEAIDPKWLLLQSFLADSDTKVSPIANFIYFYYTRDKTIYQSGTGSNQPKSENATIADSKIKTSRAWNEMCELCYDIYKFLNDNVDTYGAVPYQRFMGYGYYLDWFTWWSFYGVQRFNLHDFIPEIYRPINVLNL